MTRENQMWFWLAGVVIFAYLLWLLSAVLTPFVAGLAVAYFLDPLADKLERWMPRTAATALILLTFIAVVIGGLVILMPLLQQQILGLIGKAPEVAHAFREWLEPYVNEATNTLSTQDLDGLKAAVSNVAGSVATWLGNVLQSLLSGGRAIVSLISLVLVMPLVAFFLLRDWDKMVAKVDSLLPQDSAVTIRGCFQEIDQTIAGFVRGQATVCLILGTIYATGLSLAGLEFGLVIGILTGFLAFVPYVGMLIGLTVAYGVALMQFNELLPLLFVGLPFLFGQTLDAVFLTPQLVGGRVGLHPVWVIFALMTGGALFGFTGVLLAVPTAAVIGVLVRSGLSRYKESTLYLGTA